MNYVPFLLLLIGYFVKRKAVPLPCNIQVPTKARTEGHKEGSLILALSQYSQLQFPGCQIKNTPRGYVSKKPINTSDTAATLTSLLQPFWSVTPGTGSKAFQSGSVMPLSAKSPSSTECLSIPSEQGQDFIMHFFFVSKTKQTRQKSLTIQLQRNLWLLCHQVHTEFPETGCMYLSQPSNPQELTMRNWNPLRNKEKTVLLLSTTQSSGRSKWWSSSTTQLGCTNYPITEILLCPPPN